MDSLRILDWVFAGTVICIFGVLFWKMRGTGNEAKSVEIMHIAEANMALQLLRDLDKLMAPLHGDTPVYRRLQNSLECLERDLLTLDRSNSFKTLDYLNRIYYHNLVADRLNKGGEINWLLLQQLGISYP